MVIQEPDGSRPTLNCTASIPSLCIISNGTDQPNTSTLEEVPDYITDKIIASRDRAGSARTYVGHRGLTTLVLVSISHAQAHAETRSLASFLRALRTLSQLLRGSDRC